MSTIESTSARHALPGCRIVLADDHPIVANGVRQLLEQSGYEVVAIATSPDGLVSTLGRTPCDVLVTDFSMPGSGTPDGLALLDTLRKRWPDLPILVLTQIRSPAVLRSIIEAGASALVNKSDAPAELTLAINAVLLGCGYVGAAARRRMEASPRTREALSPRESEVLRLYASGLSVKEISELLARSAKTISNQKMAAMEKLGITSDLEIFGYASEHGLLP